MILQRRMFSIAILVALLHFFFQGSTPSALALTVLTSSVTLGLAFSARLWFLSFENPQFSHHHLRLASSARHTSWSLSLTAFVAMSFFRWKQNQSRSKQGYHPIHMHTYLKTHVDHAGTMVICVLHACYLWIIRQSHKKSRRPTRHMFAHPDSSVSVSRH